MVRLWSPWPYLASFLFSWAACMGCWLGGHRSRVNQSTKDSPGIDCLCSRTLNQLLLCIQTGSGGCCHWLWRLWGLAQGQRHQAHNVQRDGNTLAFGCVRLLSWLLWLSGVCGTQRGWQGCLSGFQLSYLFSSQFPSRVSQGDSGGPLMTKDDSGQWRLLGLVRSFGFHRQ